MVKAFNVTAAELRVIEAARKKTNETRMRDQSFSAYVRGIIFGTNPPVSATDSEVLR